jgi:DNA-binding LacI/PurR family transcriptional regulator
MRGHADEAGDRSGYDAMRHLLSLKPRPDGVFWYNDPTAMGAMKAVLDGGLEVPREVAIVGCGNGIEPIFCEFRSPAWTSKPRRAENALPSWR